MFSHLWSQRALVSHLPHFLGKHISFWGQGGSFTVYSPSVMEEGTCIGNTTDERHRAGEESALLSPSLSFLIPAYACLVYA